MKHALTVVPLPFSVKSTSSVTMEVSDIEAGYIALNYNGPNGNDPVKNSNSLFVWTGGPDIPWPLQPVANATAQAGGTAINGSYSAQTYVIGYSAGPAVTTGGVKTYPNICATAALPANWVVSEVTYSSSSLTVNRVSTNVISFPYVLPVGFNPSANGSWIGLYNGNVTPYGAPPVKWAPVTQTTSSGSAAMGGLAITPKGTYTAALFTSGYSTDPSKLDLTVIAATMVFETGAQLSKYEHKG